MQSVARIAKDHGAYVTYARGLGGSRWIL